MKKMMFFLISTILFSFSSFANNPCRGVRCEYGYQCVPYNGKGECVKCEGAGCGPIVDHASFDFDILSGGVDADTYVCEVGMRRHKCKDENQGKCTDDDYLIVKSKNRSDVVIDRDTNNPTHFKPEDNAMSANVFLNSTHYGAGWYVKYCIDITRAVAGPLAYVDKLIAKLHGTLKVKPTYNNGYFLDSGLKYRISSTCEKDPWDHGYWEPVDGPDKDNVCEKFKGFCPEGGSNCEQVSCAFLVEFQEELTCSRSIKQIKDGNHCGDDLECKLFHGKVHTELWTSVDFECTDSSCKPQRH